MHVYEASSCVCLPVYSEATVVVSSVSLWKGDTGSVIVGGREFDSQRPDESLKRFALHVSYVPTWVFERIITHYFTSVKSVQLRILLQFMCCVFHRMRRGERPPNEESLVSVGFVCFCRCDGLALR